jgi:hypothetical protein
MRTEDIHWIVEEILTDISCRDKSGSVHPEPSAVPDIESVFEEVFHEDDATSREIMRQIWQQLQETHRDHP